jgi:uncharacterized membrane protein
VIRRLRNVAHDDRGLSESVTVVLGTPLAVVVMLLVVYAGRTSETRGRLDHTAESAAQAAARERTPEAAQAAAQATASASLDIACVGAPAVTVDTAAFAPGGAVAVTIRCTIHTSDLAPLPIPGTITATGASAAIIDVWRATP